MTATDDSHTMVSKVTQSIIAKSIPCSCFLARIELKWTGLL